MRHIDFDDSSVLSEFARIAQEKGWAKSTQDDDIMEFMSQPSKPSSPNLDKLLASGPKVGDTIPVEQLWEEVYPYLNHLYKVEYGSDNAKFAPHGQKVAALIADFLRYHLTRTRTLSPDKFKFYLKQLEQMLKPEKANEITPTKLEGPEIAPADDGAEKDKKPPKEEKKPLPPDVKLEKKEPIPPPWAADDGAERPLPPDIKLGPKKDTIWPPPWTDGSAEKKKPLPPDVKLGPKKEPIPPPWADDGKTAESNVDMQKEAKEEGGKYYDVTGETGEQLVEKAHPGGGTKTELTHSKTDENLVETIVEQQKKDLEVAQSVPKGTYAMLVELYRKLHKMGHIEKLDELKSIIASLATPEEIMEHTLVSLADRLDKAGYNKAADKVDELLKIAEEPYVDPDIQEYGGSWPTGDVGMTGADTTTTPVATGIEYPGKPQDEGKAGDTFKNKVRKWQNMYNRAIKGHPLEPLAVDGIKGPKTRAALKQVGHYGSFKKFRQALENFKETGSAAGSPDYLHLEPLPPNVPTPPPPPPLLPQLETPESEPVVATDGSIFFLKVAEHKSLAAQPTITLQQAKQERAKSLERAKNQFLDNVIRGLDRHAKNIPALYIGEDRGDINQAVERVKRRINDIKTQNITINKAQQLASAYMSDLPNISRWFSPDVMFSDIVPDAVDQNVSRHLDQAGSWGIMVKQLAPTGVAGDIKKDKKEPTKEELAKTKEEKRKALIKKRRARRLRWRNYYNANLVSIPADIRKEKGLVPIAREDAIKGTGTFKDAISKVKASGAKTLKGFAQMMAKSKKEEAPKEPEKKTPETTDEKVTKSSEQYNEAINEAANQLVDPAYSNLIRIVPRFGASYRADRLSIDARRAVRTRLKRFAVAILKQVYTEKAFPVGSDLVIGDKERDRVLELINERLPRLFTNEYVRMLERM